MVFVVRISGPHIERVVKVVDFVSRNFIKTRPRGRDWGMVGGRVAREGDRMGVGLWPGL